MGHRSVANGLTCKGDEIGLFGRGGVGVGMESAVSGSGGVSEVSSGNRGSYGRKQSESESESGAGAKLSSK